MNISQEINTHVREGTCVVIRKNWDEFRIVTPVPLAPGTCLRMVGEFLARVHRPA